MHTSPTKRSADFTVLLKRLDELYGSKPGARSKPVVLVLDNRPIHKSRAALAALAARAHWVWQFLRGNWLSNLVFETYDEIIDTACDA